MSLTRGSGAPDPSGPPPPIPFAAALVLFFLSGATSLVDQVVWLRYLSFTFGNTTSATAILLSVFMGGLASGAWWWGKRAVRLRRDPIIVYALFEGAIGIFAALSPLVFSLIDVVYVAVYQSAGNRPGLFVLLRTLLAAALLLPPTFLMGGTLPLLARGFEREGIFRGRATGLLYSGNTWGALSGTLLATYTLVPLFGLRLTLGLSAAANFLIVAVVAFARRRRTAPSLDEEAIPPPPPAAPGWLLLFFAIGFASLAYEVVWTRILVFYLGSSVYAFGTMLGVILLGLAAGAAIASPLLPRLSRPAIALALLEAGVAAGVVMQIFLYRGQIDRMFRIASLFHQVTATTHAVTIFASTALLLLLPTLCMGAAFPIAIRLAAPTGEPGEGVGRVYAANTFGAIAGSLAAGFLLIPLLGTQGSLFFLAGLNLVAAAAAAAGAAPAGRRLPAALPALVAALALLPVARSIPPDEVIRSSGMLGGVGAKLLYFKEDTTCSVAVRELPFAAGPALSIEVNGVNVAGSAPDLVAIQKLQGHLPMLVHGSAKSVLHIGFGSGGTAFAVSRHPVESITIAEISPEVLRASDRYFRSINHGVLADPRVRVVIADGRNYVLASKERPDVILSDSIHPRYAGNGSLYSLDYFRLCRARLAPGGVVSMWLPIYSLTEHNLRQIVRAFTDVFPAASVWYPSTTLNPFLIVLARGDDQPLDVDRFRAAWQANPDVAAELAEIGYREPEDLLAEMITTGRALEGWVANTEPHVDDLPSVEYESGRVLNREASWARCFIDLLGHRVNPAAGLRATSDAGRAAILEAGRRAEARTPILRAHVELLRRAVDSGQKLQGTAAVLP